MKNKVIRFAIVGVVSTLADFVTYSITNLVVLEQTWITKGIGFLVGTFTGYLLNKNWTFLNSGSHLKKAPAYLFLYALSLLINVGTNQLALEFLPGGGLRTNLAFLIATLSSALINFVGLNTLIFKESRAK